MDTEIVFPSNNEKEFVHSAERLGIKKLIFLYTEKNYSSAGQILEKIDTSIELDKGLFVERINPKIKSKLMVAKSSLNDRALIETKSANMIFGMEDVHKKDSTHTRNSNLNHIICHLANEKRVTFGFSYSTIQNSENKPLVIGRMKQNLILCKKYKVKTVAASFAKNPNELRCRHDVDALIRVLQKKQL